MILLETKDYYKVANSITTVEINTLFARAVIEQKVQGKIYVDNFSIYNRLLLNIL